jgi:tripeptide aminopeptidase
VSAATAFRSVVTWAERREVHRAFDWLHLHELQMVQWQKTLVAIPAPTFAEGARAAWFLERFRELGLSNVHLDAVGNTVGELIPASVHSQGGIDEAPLGQQPSAPLGASSAPPFLLVSAHLDTVFPGGTPLVPIEDGARIACPGISDNGAGLTALLALVAAMLAGEVMPDVPVLFAANVGEEGEGNLRGIRHLLLHSEWSGRIAACMVLEGSGTATTVTRALGSRRFRATVMGPGGHSWVDAGAPNPLVILSEAISTLAALDLPAEPRSTIHVGALHGGDAINSIPREATALFDLRSLDEESLLHAEVLLHRAVEDAVLAANNRLSRTVGNRFAPAQYTIEPLGDRPSAELPPESPLWQSLQAVDRHLGLRTELRTGSTDANLPLALGLPAVALGCGGTSGGIHTPQEWYDATGRELALRRLLLVLLAMAQGIAGAAAAEPRGERSLKIRRRLVARDASWAQPPQTSGDA